MRLLARSGSLKFIKPSTTAFGKRWEQCQAKDGNAIAAGRRKDEATNQFRFAPRYIGPNKIRRNPLQGRLLSRPPYRPAVDRQAALQITLEEILQE
jgi:hypothetical protein